MKALAWAFHRSSSRGLNFLSLIINPGGSISNRNWRKTFDSAILGCAVSNVNYIEKAPPDKEESGFVLMMVKIMFEWRSNLCTARCGRAARVLHDAFMIEMGTRNKNVGRIVKGSATRKNSHCFQHPSRSFSRFSLFTFIKNKLLINQKFRVRSRSRVCDHPNKFHHQ